MKTAAVMLSGCLLVGPAPGLEMAGNTITMTDAERGKCAGGGGCLVITHTALQEMADHIKAHTLRSCKGAA